MRPIHITDNFSDLGGHSVLAARVFARMEKALGKAFPLATLSKLRPSRNWPRSFARVIGSQYGHLLSPSAPAARSHPFSSSIRGLNNEVAPHTSIEEMAGDYIENMRGVQGDGPYYIGGFSAGGVVAFEMARQLQNMAQPVGILALLDTEILTLVRDRVPLNQHLRAWWRMTKINLRYASRMTTLEYLGKKAFNLRMRRKLVTLKIRERLGFTMDASKLNAEEAFLLAFKRYVPQPFYGNATLFRAGDGAEYLDPKLGWAGIIRGYLDIQELSGDHDTILQEPHIGMLAGLLETCLARARDADPHQSVITHATNKGERLP